MAATGIPAATLAFYEDHQSPTPIHEQWEWLDWVAELSQHDFTDCAPCPGGKTCKKKYALAFSPGVPRQGTTRANDNVEFISMLVFDFDHLERAELEALCDRIAGLEAFLYSTHSHLHGGPNDCCVRLVFPLSRPLKPSEFRAVRNALISKYGFEWRRGSALVGADPSPKDLSRLYFMPTAPIGNEVEFGHQEGALLDLDELLKGARLRPSALTVASPDLLPPAFGPPLVPPAFGPPVAPPIVDMDLLRTLLKSYEPNNPHEPDDDQAGERISKETLVRRVCKGEPLVCLEEGDVRNSACHRIAKILAWNLPLATPEEAVIELVRKSVSLMPVGNHASERDAVEDRFKTISNSWNKGVTARKARIAADRALVQKLRRFKVGQRRESKPTESAPPPSNSGENDLPGIDYTGWEEKLLIYKTLQDGSRVIDSADSNAETFLIYHPEWRNVLRYNELTKDVEVNGGPLEPHENTPEQITTGVKYWLQRKCGLKLRTVDVMDAILHAAKSDSYDPVRDYLLNVARPVWDGQPRIGSFLETHCGAAVIDGTGTPIADHVQRVSRRWFLSAVARGLSPGCKMDTVLILEGEQGLKKSTAFRALAAPWFTDSSIDITNKDSKMLAGRNWFIELSELSAMRATESEAQKSFFSSQTDQFRPPYGRAISTFHRHAVFVGTTNDERYLNDLTGNRRYWPVHCLKIDLVKIRQDRDQLWGEAVAIFLAGESCAACGNTDEQRCAEHRWWLAADENKALEAINKHRLKNEYADAVRSYILKLPPESRAESYTMHEVVTEMLSIPGDRVVAVQSSVGRALKTLGFDKKRERDGDALYWRHIVPKSLLEAGQRLRLVPDEDAKIKAKREAKAAEAVTK